MRNNKAQISAKRYIMIEYFCNSLIVTVTGTIISLPYAFGFDYSFNNTLNLVTKLAALLALNSIFMIDRFTYVLARRINHIFYHELDIPLFVETTEIVYRRRTKRFFPFYSPYLICMLLNGQSEQIPEFIIKNAHDYRFLIRNGDINMYFFFRAIWENEPAAMSRKLKDILFALNPKLERSNPMFVSLVKGYLAYYEGDHAGAYDHLIPIMDKKNTFFKYYAARVLLKIHDQNTITKFAPEVYESVRRIEEEYRFLEAKMVQKTNPEAIHSA